MHVKVEEVPILGIVGIWRVPGVSYSIKELLVCVEKEVVSGNTNFMEKETH